MTYRNLKALIKCFERERRAIEFNSAQIAAYVINYSQFAPDKPVTPDMLMPSEWGKHRKQEPTQEEITNSLDRYFSGYKAHTGH